VHTAVERQQRAERTGDQAGRRIAHGVDLDEEGPEDVGTADQQRADRPDQHRRAERQHRRQRGRGQCGQGQEREVRLGSHQGEATASQDRSPA